MTRAYHRPRKVPLPRGRSPKSGGFELGHRDREPLHALLAEVDLHARIAAITFGIDDHAGAEFRMRDALADAESGVVAVLLEVGPFLLREIRILVAGIGLPRAGRLERHGALLLAREARREPLLQALGDFLEEKRSQAVARLAVQHARLREGQVQALARARDRDIGEAPLLLQAILLHHALL